MQADVYQKIKRQDPESNRIVEDWVFQETIKCYANGIVTDAVSDASSGKKYNRDYTEYEFINVWATKNFSKRHRITNIRTMKDQQPVWVELETPNLIPTIFEVQGSVVEIDPFGSVMDYKILCKRTEVQRGIKA